MLGLRGTGRGKATLVSEFPIPTESICPKCGAVIDARIVDSDGRALLLAGMHFQDSYTYELDRIRRCVVQYAAPDGKLYPFCTYNSGPCYRQTVERRFGVSSERAPKRRSAARVD